ncbi:MAG: hypothetical protein AAGA56_16145 [Myxococcota bacterium]
MTGTLVEIPCPHCGRVYRLKLELKVLDDARATARCGRCGKRFSLSRRARERGTFPAVREHEVPTAAHEGSGTSPRRPLRRRGERRASTGRPSPNPSGGASRSSMPQGASIFARPGPEGSAPWSSPEASVADAPRAERNTDPPATALSTLAEPPLRASIADAWPRARRATPRMPSEPPPGREPFVTRPAVASRLLEATPRPDQAAISDFKLDVGAPVGDTEGEEGASVELSLLPEDLTPVPSQIMGHAYLLDPETWLARADPGPSALAPTGRMEGAEALRWLLEDDHDDERE